MKLLISNDDGYQAEGIAVLAQAMSNLADITVIAPEANRSCASSSLSVRKDIRVRTKDNGWICVDGSPGDCVHLAVNGLLKQLPDMVVAGINHGSNLGDEVIYSGTVAAAIEGRFLSMPAVAFSLASETAAPQFFETAARVARQIVSHIIQYPLAADTLLNVNIPDIDFNRVKGIAVTHCGSHLPSKPAIRQPKNGEHHTWQIGPAGSEDDAGPGSDIDAVKNGYVSITPIQINLTRHQQVETVAQWSKGISID